MNTSLYNDFFNAFSKERVGPIMIFKSEWWIIFWLLANPLRLSTSIGNRTPILFKASKGHIKSTARNITSNIKPLTSQKNRGSLKSTCTCKMSTPHIQGWKDGWEDSTVLPQNICKTIWTISEPSKRLKNTENACCDFLHYALLADCSFISTKNISQHFAIT